MICTDAYGYEYIKGGTQPDNTLQEKNIIIQYKMAGVAGAGVLMLCCLASSGGAYIFSQQEEDPLSMGPSLSPEAAAAAAQLEIDRAAATAAAQLEADQAVTGCVGYWDENWDDCSTSCGGGKKYKYWNTTAEPRNGGTPCPDPEIKERSCNTQVCPGDEVKNCLGSHDTEWSACSATCGGGTKTKVFNVTQYPQNGGNPCPLDITQPCNTQACPTAEEIAAAVEAARDINCVVTDPSWSACSATCGGGIQSRTLVVTTPQQNEGDACPALDEQRACNPDPCLVETLPTWDSTYGKKWNGGTKISDIQMTTLNDTTPCEAACFNDETCEGFTTNLQGNKCVLKSGNISKSDGFGLTAYKIQRGEPGEPTPGDDTTPSSIRELFPDWIKKTSKRYTGGEVLRTVDGSDNIQKCRDECFFDKRCKSFYYKYSGANLKQCKLTTGTTLGNANFYNTEKITRNFE